MSMPASFADLDAWENELFDEYNGEGRCDPEAMAYAELDELIMSKKGE